METNVKAEAFSLDALCSCFCTICEKNRGAKNGCWDRRESDIFDRKTRKHRNMKRDTGGFLQLSAAIALFCLVNMRASA